MIQNNRLQLCRKSWLRLVEPSDANYIWELRQNDKKNAHLSPVTGTVSDQELWILAYKQREAQNQEYYFMIESQSGSLGTIRLYDLRPHSFCWGSWIVQDGAPPFTAIESMLTLYNFGFNTLGYKNTHFDIRKKNRKVLAFKKQFGATLIHENETTLYFSLSKGLFEIQKMKYKRLWHPA